MRRHACSASNSDVKLYVCKMTLYVPKMGKSTVCDIGPAHVLVKSGQVESATTGTSYCVLRTHVDAHSFA